MAALPNQVNYMEQISYLPSGINNYTSVAQPVNGASFTQNSQIIVDLPQRGCIDPKSIYIRYKMTVPAQTVASGGIIGCPVYTPFQRVDTFVNGTLLDTVNDYNIVAHQWSNLYLSVSDKYAVQSAFQYVDSTPLAVTLDELDGHVLTVGAPNAGETYFASAPLVCTQLTGCNKFIPSFAMGAIRLIFTLDSASNVFSNGVTVGTTTFTITNFEIVYDMIDMGAEFEQSVMAMDKLVIKTNGYNCSSVAIPQGTNGQNTYVFNQRFASIRNAVVLPSGTATSANFVNGKFDAVDMTSGNGSLQLNVGNVMFPQGGPLSTINNKSGILQELRKATGNLYDWSKSMSINTYEFSYVSNPAPTTLLAQPGKFYVGFDLNKINSMGDAMLNGTSSQNAPINVIVNSSTATAQALNLYLVLNYDAILTIDPRTKQTSILQ